MTPDQIFTVVVVAISCAAAAAIVPVAAYFWYWGRVAEQNAVLKQSMIEKGYSADEIVRVLSEGAEVTETAGRR